MQINNVADLLVETLIQAGVRPMTSRIERAPPFADLGDGSDVGRHDGQAGAAGLEGGDAPATDVVIGVDDADRVVLVFIDQRAVRRARDVVFDLLRNLQQTVTDDLGRDRVHVH